MKRLPAALPAYMTLLSQRITLERAPNLCVPCPGSPEGEEPHTDRAYGVYDEATQAITLDDGLGFERSRETLVHECLHAMLAVTQIDNLVNGELPGFDEHIASALAPVMLSWLRDNPALVGYLQETMA